MDDIVFLTCHLYGSVQIQDMVLFVFHTRALLVLSLIKQAMFL